MEKKAYNTDGREAVFTSKQSNRQNARGQESHGRRDQEDRIQLHARRKINSREIHYRHQTELCQRRNETSNKQYSPRTLPTSVLKPIEQVGTDIQRRQHNHAD